MSKFYLFLFKFRHKLYLYLKNSIEILKQKIDKKNDFLST